MRRCKAYRRGACRGNKSHYCAGVHGHRGKHHCGCGVRFENYVHCRAGINLGRRGVPDEVVAAMHADYMRGMSLNAVGRKYDRHRASVRSLFKKRGYTVKPPTMKMPKHISPTGQFLPAPPLTTKEIKALIAKATKLTIPDELKVEWRKWSLERRADFIRRVKAKLGIAGMPKTPHSANVEPFDYGSERAWEICRKLNAGLGSRQWVVKMNLISEGMIWNGRLFFFCGADTGYCVGPWRPETGRPELHRVIYAHHHGVTLTPDDRIRFADGNPNNFDPANLVRMTANDVCRENQAAALAKKSRAITAVLLNRAQSKETTHDRNDTFTQLRRRQR